MHKLALNRIFIAFALVTSAEFVASCGSPGSGEAQLPPVQPAAQPVSAPVSAPVLRPGSAAPNGVGDKSTPTSNPVVNVTTESLSVGFGTVCQLQATAGLQCFNFQKNEGTGYQVALTLPSQVSVGSAHACASVGANGKLTVMCWPTDLTATPTKPLAGLDQYSKVSVGFGFSWPAARLASIFQEVGREYACAVGADGSLKCWSWMGATAAVEEKVPQLKNVSQVTVGTGQACAIAGSDVVCWIWSGGQELARLATPALQKATHVVLGTPSDAQGELPRAACATTPANSANPVQCWGWISTGLLVPLPAPPLSKPLPLQLQLSLAGNEACAIGDDGVHCWLWVAQGSHFVTKKLKIPSLQKPTQLSVSFESICVKDLSGGRCWGRGFLGPTTLPTIDIAPSDSTHEILVLGDSLTCGPFGAKLVRNLNENPLNHVTVYCATGSRPGDWLEGNLPLRTYDQKMKKATSYYACETCKGSDCADWYTARDPSDANFKQSCGSKQSGKGPKLSDILQQSPHFDSIIVALGTNSISFGSRIDASYTQMLALIQSDKINSCLWIGPPRFDTTKDPDHVSKNKKPVTQIMEDRLGPFYASLSHALQKGNCNLIDSREASVIASTADTISDGIHRTASAGERWADRLAPSLETPAEAQENRAPFQF